MGNTPQGPYGLPGRGQPTEGPDNAFQPAVKNRDVFLADCGIDPPIANYIDVDDVFVAIASANGSAGPFNINMRIMRPDGRVEIVTKTLGSIPGGGTVSTTWTEREGYLLSACFTSPGGLAGTFPIWVQLGIRRGGSNFPNDHRVLIAAYAGTTNNPSWPDRQPQRGAEGPGWVMSTLVTTPAAGADWTYTIPAAQRMSIYLVSAQLVAANAGTPRVVTLQLKDYAGNFLAAIDCPNTQAINTTFRYTAYAGAFIGGTAGTNLYIPLPSPLFAQQNYVLSSSTLNINAADQWSAIRIAALQWIDIF